MSVLTNCKKEKPVAIKIDNSKTKIKKTRGYFAGQKMTPQQMEDEVIRLSKKMKIFEIAEYSGKDRRTIERILEKAKESGKILTSSSGRITLPEDELAKRDYQRISRDELYDKYQPVKNWVDKRRAEAKGDKTRLNHVRQQLGKLKVVCDTTRLNPYVLLSAGENGESYGGLERVMGAFAIAMTEGRVIYQNAKQKQPDPDNIDSAYRENLIACRNFAMYNGVSIPKFPPEHILSGKKVAFGQYAHIKLTEKEIDQCVRFLTSQHGIDSFEVASFVFYYITGTRDSSIYKIKTPTVQTNEHGWITCMVYESKTRTTWKKYIQNDNPHFEILQKWFDKRVSDRKPFLFSEDGKSNKISKKRLAESFRDAYRFVGATEDYFFKKPFHTLRHVMAHFFLDKTNNHALVAKLGGWKDIQILALIN